jgi:apolipoprotein N-acyltransferase
MGAALCYDYDFPQLAAEHGAHAADLVALPSSDWRGIDPIHTQMAAVRAIEQGISIVRSTRFGLSAGIDPHGRLRAWSSSFDAPDRVTIIDLPRRGTPTLYRRTGDAFAWLCAAFLAAAAVDNLRGRRGRRSA